VSRHILYPLQFLWGIPAHQTELMVTLGRMHDKNGPRGSYGVSHRVKLWYGVAWRSDWFIGFCRLVERIDGPKFQGRLP
jgi:hypothetical protein